MGWLSFLISAINFLHMNILQSVSSSQVSLLTINFQRLICNLIKFHVAKEANEAVLFFVQNLEVIFDR